MNLINIKDIEVRYDDNQEISYIKNVINNNYNLFLSLLGESKVISLIPTNDDKVVYISDFDETFYEVVNQTFNNDGNNALLENPDLLPAFYIETLIRKNANNPMALVQPNPNVSDEMLYSLIAYIYFTKTGTFDDFVNYLKEKKETDKILNWLQTETRFDAYNYLLKTTTDYLMQNDFDFLQNISGITNMMLTQSLNNVLAQQQETEIELPTITIQEFDNLFNEFLVYINAPKSWKQVYDELKTRGRISFEKQVDDLDTSMCYRDDNDVLRILVSTDGTIKCFCSFVHEFMHYIPMQDSMTLTQFSISEFPSIFFEKVSAQFLRDKGFKQDVVDRVVRDRNKNNTEIYIGISSLFNDISAYINGGAISREKKILFWENNFRAIQETREKLAKLMEENGEQVDISFLEPPKIDIPKEIDKECDSLIDSFIQNGLLVINGYQYLLDTYLAEEVLKKSNDDTSIIPRMINVTDNLGNMNLKDVLTEFNIQGIIDDTKEKGNIKSKKI